MMPRDEALPPVPPDAADGPVISASQLPWAAIPRFQPGITNVQEYVKKLEFLAAMWPIEYLDLLAPRAALLVEGSAFAAISKLDAQKLKVKSLDGIKTLVNAIGGSWGATDFQERFEYFERALYGTIQKQDESNDSFIARMEAVFSELLSRKTSLEEIQAYVLLRQSTLPADDKKRVLLENPQLSYPPVMKALRLLGSKFFQEVQTGKATQKTKVYDTMVTEEASDGSCMVSQSMLADDDEVSSEFLEALVSQDDPDAVAVQAFETEFEDFVQDTPDMQVALISYLEARQRLQDKRRGRGFWPAHGTGKSKGKSKFNKGSFKGQHQGRQNLLAKIAKSRCRNCNQLGHWKAECPMKDRDSFHGSLNFPLPPAAAAQLGGVGELREAGGTMDDAEIFTDADLMKVHRDFFDVSPCVQECFMSVHFSWNNPQNKTKLSNSMKRLNAVQRQPMSHSYNQCFMPSAPAECNRVQLWHPKHVMQPARTEKMEYLPEMSALHSSEAKPAHAILDTGASRCIIGTQPLSRLLQRLPSDVRSTVQRRESKIKFRFGNNQTLTSMYRVLLPLYGPNCEKVWLGVEVVEGTTPFLFSKRAFKQLGGILDTNTDTCTLQRLQKTIELCTNATGLYLIDMSEFCQPHFGESKNCPEVFVGSASHVGENTSSARKTNTIRAQLTVAPIQKYQNVFTNQPLDSSVVPDAPLFRESCQNVESRSCNSHAEGDGQHHHGDFDSCPPGVNEHDRDSQSRCSRGGNNASTDQSAACHESRDDAPACPSATTGRESECSDSWKWKPSTPSVAVAGARDWHPRCTSHASFGNTERRRRFGQLLHGVLLERSKEQPSPSAPSQGSSENQSGSSIEPSSSAHVTTTTSRDCGDLWKQQCFGGTVSSEADLGRMGSKEDLTGSQTPWPNVLPSAERGHGVFRVEPVQVQLPSSSSTRFRRFLPSPTGSECCSGSRSSRTECPSPCMSLDANLAGMIESCKIECSRFTPHKEEVQYQHALKTSLDAVQRICR